MLFFSFVGMKNKEITVGAQQQEVNVMLESEAENLDVSLLPDTRRSRRNELPDRFPW